MARILFECTDEDKALWVETASRERLSLSAWIRRQLMGSVSGPPIGGGVVEYVSPSVPLEKMGSGPPLPPNVVEVGSGVSGTVGSLKIRDLPPSHKRFGPDPKKK